MSEEEVANFKVPLRALADKRLRIAAKKRLLNQSSGFLGPFLSAILPTFPSLVFRSRDA
jgi:hypothetical protein